MNNYYKVALPTHCRTLQSIILCFDSLISQIRKTKEKDLGSTVEVVLTNDNLVDKLIAQVKERKSKTYYNPNQMIIEENNNVLITLPDDLSIENLMNILCHVRQKLFTKMANSKNTISINAIELKNGTLKFVLADEKGITKIEKIESKLMLIDGSNMLASSYYATSYNKKPSQLLKTKDGTYTNGIYTMLRKFFNICKTYRPTHLAICWDISRKTFRRELFPDYKAHRSAIDPELKEQFTTAQTLFKQMNVPQFSAAGYEADDLIASIQKKWTSQKDGLVYLVSTDQDLYQLLDENTIILKKTEYKKYSLQSFYHEFEISPEQWVDVKALAGDTSDNIPGVKGIGSKTAVQLVKKYRNLEGVYQYIHSIPKEKMKKTELKIFLGEEKAFLSKQLATILSNVPILHDIDSIKLNINRSAMIKELERLELVTIINEIKSGKYKAS